MTDQMQGLREDVAFMRGLAEEGRNAPLLGGDISVAAGLIYGAASFATYAGIEGVFGLTPEGIGWVWLAASVIFGLALLVSIRRQKGEHGVETAANRANSAAWGGAGMAIFALFGGFFLAAYRTDEWIVMTMLAPVILALYGAAWGVAGAMTGRTWNKGVAGLSLVLSLVTAWFAGSAEQWLVYGVALLLTAFFPGLVMLRQAHRAA